MHVKVLIKRSLPEEEDRQRKLLSLIAMMRAKVAHHKGYVTSEVLWNVEHLNEVLSITEWRNLDAWKSWLADEGFKTLQQQIDELGCETRFEIYTHPEEEWNMPIML